jgi:hypothetical protein
VHTGFIADAILDRLPTGVRLGAARIGSVDLNTPRRGDALRAGLAPNRFTVAEFAAKVGDLTSVDHASDTNRRTAYDLRKLCGKQLLTDPVEPAAATSRRCRAHHRCPAHPALTRSSPPSLLAPAAPVGRKPTHRTRVDCDYQRIRIGMPTLFNDLAVETSLAA